MIGGRIYVTKELSDSSCFGAWRALASSVWTDAPKFYTTAIQFCTGWIDRLDLGSKGN